jgi:hypothetical protein
METAFSYVHANYLCGGGKPQEYDGDTANPL